MTDDWGQDPSVQAMRRVFAAMDKEQRDLLGALGISPLDPRLRRVRDRARALYELALTRKVQGGERPAESDSAVLYGRCFAHALGNEGIAVPPELLSTDPVPFPGTRGVIS